MIPFDAYSLISLWETDPLPPAEKAARLLALLHPEASEQAIGAMTLGQRDQALFHKRGELFGDDLEGITPCAECGEELELSLQVSHFLSAADLGGAAAQASIEFDGELDSELDSELDGIHVVFRVATSDDAIAVCRIADRADARRALARRCIVSATRDDEPVDITDALIDRVAEHMESLDPLSEIQLDLTCEACEHEQSVHLDIGSYLWNELVSEAERLLDEVSALARAYGWREADILAMSGKRRQFYLDRSP